MADRRRINGPNGVTLTPVFLENAPAPTSRSRPSTAVRATYLKTGVTPSASGSAFLEVAAGNQISGMKLACTVHGPRSLPRSTPFSPHMMISTHVKYAPFATKQRRGYLRDSSERDLSIHLDTALRGALIAHRWPKSGVDVIVTVIEGEEEPQVLLEHTSEGWSMLNVLSGCITVAAAALADAGIDSVDIVCGGVAALISSEKTDEEQLKDRIVVDPIPSEHRKILAACCVAYLPSRGEITNLWMKGPVFSPDLEVQRHLIAKAVHASKGSGQAIKASLREALKSE